ncbi:MAG: hypothetical protein GC159_20780 [Phycisphaera sp.]|nr:hypothetical protein [Phycisphaera sp.]
MGRRRNKSAPSISLFPFLSILACVIGVLTLLISALALGQIDPSAVEEAEQRFVEQEQRAAQHEALSQGIITANDRITELKRMITEAETAQKQVAAARAELEQLEAERQKMLAKANDKTSANLLAEANRLRVRVAELEPELKETKEKIAELKAELADRRKPPEPAKVMIRPGGSGVGLDPSFVECAYSSVVIYEGDKPQRVRRADLATSDVFIDLLKRVAERPDGTIIFLVRTDGLGTYYTARSIARANYVRNGKLPVVGDGEIDLTLFNAIKKH